MSKHKLKKANQAPLFTRDLPDESLIATVAQYTGADVRTPSSNIESYLIKSGLKRGTDEYVSLKTLYSEYKSHCKSIKARPKSYKSFIDYVSRIFKYSPRGRDPGVLIATRTSYTPDPEVNSTLTDLTPYLKEETPIKPYRPSISRNKNTPNPKVRTQYKGVYRHHRRFKAKVWFKGKQKIVGIFITAKEAAMARDRYIVKLWGELARPHLNFPSKYNRYQYEILQETI